MADQSSSHDKIVIDNVQSLKYLTHWPSVDIKFEDIKFTIENGSESKWIFSDNLSLIHL